MSVTTSFVEELLQRHDLTEVEPTTSLQQEELNDQAASEHNIALKADQQELYKQTVGDLVWLATACRPDLSFEVHLLTQSLTTPTRGQEMQLQKVLSYLKGTLHYSLSLHPTTKRNKEEPQSLELVAFSSTSWTEACKATNTAYLSLWGASLIASCKTSCAQKQEHAELESMRLALALASHTKSFLQQLDMEDVHISLRTSSWNQELVTGRPIAKQLGLSRRNKHIQLRGQLQLSKVHPNKNLAHSLSHNASDKTMLAKLRIDTEAAKTGALSTVQGPCLASFLPSSSLWVGMVNLEPPKMESLQLRQLALSKSETCNESLSKNLADKSLASLTLPSLSLQRSNSESLTLDSWSFPIVSLTLPSLSRIRDRFHSLTLHSLSLTKGNLESLTLQSLSLIDENGFQRISFREVSFEDGSLKENEKSLAHTKLERRAETNSFPQLSFPEDQLAETEAKTNSFSNQSLNRILSFRMCLRIFWFCSFQLVCAALLLKNSSFRMSLPTESLQADQLQAAYSRSSFQQTSLQQEELLPAYFRSSFDRHSLQQEELVTAYSRRSFHQESLLQDELAATQLQSPTRASQLSSFEKIEPLDNSNHQLDLETSLSLSWFSLLRCSNSSFELRALLCAALLYTRIRNRQLQSFQLTRVQLGSLVQGGAFTTLQTRASSPPLQCIASTLTAWTLISLSLAITAWLKTASLRACRGRPLRKSLTTTSFRRSASTTAFPTTAFRTTSSFRRTWLSMLLFSFLFNIFFSNSFRGQEIEKEDELLQTVLEQELEELLANKPCPLDLHHDHLGQENLWQIQLQQNNLEKNKHKQQKQLSATVPDRELRQLHLHQLCLQDPDSAISRQLPEESLSSSFSKKRLSEQDLFNISLDKFFPENFGKQLAENQLQQNLSTDQRQLQKNKLTQNTFQQLSLEQPSFTEKILNNELATTFAKNSLIDNLVFQNFFYATLALQKTASEQLGEKDLYKKQLEQRQPHPDRRRSLQRTASHNWLSRSQLEPAAFQHQLGSAEWGQSSFTTRTSSKRASRRRACRQEL